MRRVAVVVMAFAVVAGCSAGGSLQNLGTSEVCAKLRTISALYARETGDPAINDPNNVSFQQTLTDYRAVAARAADRDLANAIGQLVDRGEENARAHVANGTDAQSVAAQHTIVLACS